MAVQTYMQLNCSTEKCYGDTPHSGLGFAPPKPARIGLPPRRHAAHHRRFRPDAATGAAPARAAVGTGICGCRPRLRWRRVLSPPRHLPLPPCRSDPHLLQGVASRGACRPRRPTRRRPPRHSRRHPRRHLCRRGRHGRSPHCAPRCSAGQVPARSSPAPPPPRQPQRPSMPTADPTSAPVAQGWWATPGGLRAPPPPPTRRSGCQWL